MVQPYIASKITEKHVYQMTSDHNLLHYTPRFIEETTRQLGILIRILL